MVSSIQTVTRHTLKHLLGTLRSLVLDNFPENPSIIYIKSSEHTIVDSGIPFNIKILESLNRKPQAEKNKFEINPTNVKKEDFDPFVPPFEPK